MIKLIATLKRKSHLSTEEFLEYWHKKHAPFALKVIPDEINSVILKYAQNHPVKLGKGEGTTYDGVAEFCFEDLEGLRKWSDWYFSDDGKALRDDEEVFMDTSKRVIVVTEEKVMIP